ncbi:hypothetical protein RER83_05390 [Bacillus velezensis]|uniref:hypothetical protein n=1 Tax=Bacillus amyloliquefaciens group TaxID=1938374 RepID=UPI0028083C0F|nr:MULTISPECIES: hypothetical protein [Bacillus amyloliquefaciens group]MDQ8055671.1 hypothetical protein [Bacillus velezensis]MEB4596891.1 hypothetical protein [Bacillus amyloliquefaciens]
MEDNIWIFVLQSGEIVFFRRLRRFASLEQSITVLLTGSVCLQSICGQILIDEEKHIEFQAETLINK